MTTAQRPIIRDNSDHSHDIVAITELVERIERGFNTNDANMMTSPFTENASIVDAAGRRQTGIDEIVEAGRQGLAGSLRGQLARYDLDDIVFLRPDVAIAQKRAWAITTDGEPLDVEHGMTVLYVFVKEAGSWWVAARQNTLTQSV